MLEQEVRVLVVDDRTMFNVYNNELRGQNVPEGRTFMEDIRRVDTDLRITRGVASFLKARGDFRLLTPQEFNALEDVDQNEYQHSLMHYVCASMAGDDNDAGYFACVAAFDKTSGIVGVLLALFAIAQVELVR